jgi:hypothetical protein
MKSRVLTFTSLPNIISIFLNISGLLYRKRAFVPGVRPGKQQSARREISKGNQQHKPHVALDEKLLETEDDVNSSG